MKTIKNIAAVCLVCCGLAATFTACEIDNYDEPDAAIEGTIFDSTTGLPLETAAGKSSMQMRIWETSWGVQDSSITVAPQDLNMRQDGTYTNTKLFPGNYDVVPFQGAFYPLDDEAMQHVTLSSGKTTRVDFTVTPYLTLEWVTEPYVDATDTLRCAVRFTRNAGDGPMPDVKQLQLYISHNQYVGTGTDPQVTPPVRAITNDEEGTVIELKSLPIKYSNRYWVRVGGNCSDAYQKMNFTSIRQIDVTVNH